MSSSMPAPPVMPPGGGGGSGAPGVGGTGGSSENAQSKKDLTSWWKNFKRSDRDKHQKEMQAQVQAPQGIFGVPLQSSIRYANVAISLFNDEGQSYIYGYVPIVVAKCGVFLKEKATDVEGIFRLSGSEKRIKELKVAFDSPDRYGKGLDWTGYTVHDAANILRRYFNQLPEPIIPLDFYERFRSPIRNHQAQAVGAMDAQTPSVGEFDHDAAIVKYQNYITELPPLNRQLLLYILDLLAVFASKSDLNKMTTPNLAAIFQPGILSAPQHDMAPQEYRLSQDVLIFLIENQDSFLIGMQGTAADPETVKEVQSGVPTPKTPTTPTTPSRSKTVVGRTSSNASVGAESIRRSGPMRRNASVSSKHSKKSDAFTGTPVSPGGTHTPPGTGAGVHRSNTVPSKRSGAARHSPRYANKHSDPPTPSPSAVAIAQTVKGDKGESSIQSTPVAPIAERFENASLAMPKVTPPSAPSSEGTTPLAINSDAQSALSRETGTSSKKDTTPLLAPHGASSSEPMEQRGRNVSSSTTSSRGFLDTFFKPSPGADTEGSRKPNKLQKRRIPGSSLSSAQSSSQSLQLETTNESHQRQHSQQRGGSGGAPRTPISPTSPTEPYPPASPDDAAYMTAHSTPVHSLPTNPLATAGAAIWAPTPQRMATDATLRPASPTQSFTSASRTSVTDTSDADLVGDDMPPQTPSHRSSGGTARQGESGNSGAAGGTGEGRGKEKKKHRWRFSRQEKQNIAEAQQSQQRGESVGGVSGYPAGPGSQWAGSARRRSQDGTEQRGQGQATEPGTPATLTQDKSGNASTPTAASTSTPGGANAGGFTSDAGVFSDSEREGKRGLFSRFRSKIQERKETREAERERERRGKTPESRGRGGSESAGYGSEVGGGQGCVPGQPQSSVKDGRAGRGSAEVARQGQGQEGTTQTQMGQALLQQAQGHDVGVTPTIDEEKASITTTATAKATAAADAPASATSATSATGVGHDSVEAGADETATAGTATGSAHAESGRPAQVGVLVPQTSAETGGEAQTPESVPGIADAGISTVAADASATPGTASEGPTALNSEGAGDENIEAAKEETENMTETETKTENGSGNTNTSVGSGAEVSSAAGGVTTTDEAATASNVHTSSGEERDGTTADTADSNEAAGGADAGVEATTSSSGGVTETEKVGTEKTETSVQSQRQVEANEALGTRGDGAS